MRVSADIGGTFTDLVVEARTGEFRLFKVPTTPQVYFPAQINVPENAI
jgi:N-methylhydantoinase A/oxoprolinase/acetone carboxylase beta subunit